MSESVPVRVEGLTKRFGSNLAVDRLSLEVPAGSIFGLLGENGAGKTTTIQVLLGLIRPDDGRVEVLGLDPSRRGLEVRRRVGYVPEQPSLYDWMTVAEIGWFASGFHPHCPDGSIGYQLRYRNLAEGFGLPGGRKIKHLSKGMRARVSLGLALAAEPGLLILDEPTSGLDVLVRRDFLESMVDLAGAGRTVVLSSHQVAEVERVASHVALLHRGRLILAEPLERLKARTFAVTVSSVGGGEPVAFPAGLPVAFPAGLPVEVVDVEESARQARWLVHASDRSAFDALRTLPGVVGVEVQTPSLEEIYVAYIRGRRPESPPRPAPARVA